LSQIDIGNARAGRTLDIARIMLLTCGYKRTTIEEIARRAEIGKGTVYLHWRTKDDLVNTLVTQDVTAVFAEITAAVRADPRAAMLHHVVHRLFTAAAKYPLFRALFARDKQIMGRSAGSPGGTRRYRITSLEPFRNYLALLCEYDCLRTGLDLESACDGLDALIAGHFVIQEESESRWQQEPVAKHAYALATLVRSSLEKPGLPTLDVLRQVAEKMEVCFEGFGQPFIQGRC
jgi:AcrR family transcriptional regulator